MRWQLKCRGKKCPKILGAIFTHFLGVSGPGSTTIVWLIKFCKFQEKFGQESSPRLNTIFPLKFEETFTPGWQWQIFNFYNFNLNWNFHLNFNFLHFQILNFEILRFWDFEFWDFEILNFEILNFFPAHARLHINLKI